MSDPRDDIQVHNPVPPWEQPGCFRLDGEPHRGDLLWWLAFVSGVFSGLVAFPCYGWVPGLVSIVPCLTIRQMARRDLARMRTGLIDPRGESITASAEQMTTSGYGSAP